jgi:hypothetical protein
MYHPEPHAWTHIPKNSFLEFVFEIRSRLLTTATLRRLQDLLTVRGKVIQDKKQEKEDLEKSLEASSSRWLFNLQEQRTG